MTDVDRCLGEVRALQKDVRGRLGTLLGSLKNLEAEARRAGDSGLRLGCAASVRLLGTLMGGFDRLLRLPLVPTVGYPEDVTTDAERELWDRAADVAGRGGEDRVRAIYLKMSEAKK